ncbi:MAG: efflux RND transporter permease subunit, partial [Chloroflexota bacterium]
PVAKDKKVNWFYRGFNRAYEAVERRYMGLVKWMVRRPRSMACLFLIVVGATLVIFARHPTAFLPTEDQGYCVLVAQLPAGASQLRVREVSAAIDAVLKKVPGVKGWITSGGFSELDSANLSNVVTKYVMYEDWNKRAAELSQNAIVAELRKRLQSIRKAQFDVLIPPPIPGLGQAGGFQMMVEDRAGIGLAPLEKTVQQMALAADREAGLRGITTTFNSRSPQLHLTIDRTMAESLGVTIDDVFQTLQTSLGSTYVNLFNKFNQSFQVRMQADADYRKQFTDIANLYVANRSRQMVPLGALLKVRRVLGSELITRYNLYPAASLIGRPASGFSSGEALAIMERIAKDNMPLNTGYDWTGISYQEKLIGNQAYFIFALSITLVFLVLAAQYESWTDPAAVVLTVPMALVGVITALISRGLPSDLYTQIGLVLMIALAAKNAILIVEFARTLKAEGMPTVDAAVEATHRRFRPILMTSIAFILGVVPLMTASGAGAASQQSLGTVVFGGMLASTLLAIPFVSVFYIVMESFSERRRVRKEVNAAHPELAAHKVAH